MRQMTYMVGSIQRSNPYGYITSEYLYPMCSKYEMVRAYRKGFRAVENDFDTINVMSKNLELLIAVCQRKEDADHIVNLLEIERLLSNELPEWIVFAKSQLGKNI